MNLSSHCLSPLGSRLPCCLVGLVACALLGACTTNRPVWTTDPAQLTSIVKAGDHVSCTLNNYSRVEFKVTAVEPAALVGNSRHVPVADIAWIEIRRFDGGKTALFCVASVVAIAGLLVIGSNLGLGLDDAPVYLYP